MLVRNSWTVLFIMLLTCSCNKKQEDTVSSQIPPSTSTLPLPIQAATTNISSGDCSVILNSVTSASEISINQACDIPSEKKIIKLLLEGPFINQCHLAWPQSWILIDNSPELSFVATPQAGDYFSKYKFQYKTELASTSISQNVFFASEWVDYDSKLKDRTPITKEDFNKLLSKRKQNQGCILDSGMLLEAIYDMTPGSKVGSFSIRSKISYEDGNSVESTTLSIYKVGNEINAGASIFPLPNEDADVLTEEPTGYTFSCSATADIDKSIFSTLCASLIERATLSEKYPGTYCEITESGLIYKKSDE